MKAVTAAIDFLFGCHHRQLIRVFTIDGQTYRVCCDCGAKFKYSLERMCILQQLPPHTELAWCLMGPKGRFYDSTRDCRT